MKLGQQMGEPFAHGLLAICVDNREVECLEHSSPSGSLDLSDGKIGGSRPVAFRAVSSLGLIARQLNLSANTITDSEVTVLSESFAKNAVITSLVLRDNLIGEVGCTTLCMALATTKSGCQ